MTDISSNQSSIECGLMVSSVLFEVVTDSTPGTYSWNVISFSKRGRVTFRKCFGSEKPIALSFSLLLQNSKDMCIINVGELEQES